MKKNNIHNEIKEIAYDVNKDYGYTVYIKENLTFVPYLVLTDNYNGNVLLLRKYVLNEEKIFNPSKRYSGYYENSSIDEYLNKDFFNNFHPEVQNKIIDSKLVITAKSSVGICGTTTTDITRKVFLLSYTELGLTKYAVAAVEGEALKYFDNATSRIAYCKTGDACGWWLRSPFTTYDTLVWSVGYDSTSGEVSASYTNGVRPAFCVDGKMLIETNDEIIKGETIYILKQ